MPNPGSSNYDPEQARHTRPQPFRAKFGGTLIIVGGLIVLLVALSVIARIV